MGRHSCVRIPIRPGETERLAGWARSLESRRDEVRRALEAEGIDAEVVLLERGPDGDALLIYTVAEDPAAANAAFEASTEPVDVEFRALMAETLDVSGAAPVEVILAAGAAEGPGGPEVELPRIETDRLLLRVPGPEDAEAMAAYVIRNRDHLGPWEPRRDDGYFTEAFWRRRLAETRRQALAGTTLTLVLQPRDAPLPRILGQITFSGITRGPFHAAYLGYGIDREAEGRGLMAEALGAALEHAFENLGLHRVMANHVPENDRSARLLERLGFVREGLAPDYLRIDGEWRDHVLTALVNPRWRGER